MIIVNSMSFKLHVIHNNQYQITLYYCINKDKVTLK